MTRNEKWCDRHGTAVSNACTEACLYESLPVTVMARPPARAGRDRSRTVGGSSMDWSGE